MSSKLDAAKIISKQLFMTQSVACLLKHEMEAETSFQKQQMFFQLFCESPN